MARGDLLFFVDADVALRPDATAQVLDAFAGEPHLAAVFGSYDDAPAAENFLSQYKNLLHHWVHQTGREEASTFWAGCGAIRREVLRKLNAAKGGGYVFQSDHSVSSAVSGQAYDYIVKLVREFGNYPIRLPAEFEETI